VNVSYVSISSPLFIHIQIRCCLKVIAPFDYSLLLSVPFESGFPSKTKSENSGLVSIQTEAY